MPLGDDCDVWRYKRIKGSTSYDTYYAESIEYYSTVTGREYAQLGH